jgi:hypothetical protein
MIKERRWLLFFYKSLIENLLYLITTRSNVIFAASLFFMFMNSPRHFYVGAAKKIFKYIQDTWMYWWYDKYFRLCLFSWFRCVCLVFEEAIISSSIVWWSWICCSWFSYSASYLVEKNYEGYEEKSKKIQQHCFVTINQL